MQPGTSRRVVLEFPRMKLAFRIIAPLLIVAIGVFVARHFILSKPEPRTFSAPEEVTRVDATRLKKENFQVFLQTQGTVRPRTTSNLIPEVSGRVIEISPNFRDGGFFEKGEVLVKIDPLDYETALVLAKSTLAQAKTAIEEEKVRADQALENWRRLGKRGDPNDLAARKPQLAQAEANLKAAEAEVKQAERNLERTQVKAPFDGRIIEQNVDVGQFVSSNTQLGRAFATDVMEVRLPLTNRQLAFVDLPDGFRDESEKEKGPEVLIKGRIGRETGHWTGRVVRVDSAIDEASRQLFVVAEVEDPYRRKTEDAAFPLKIGMFVDGMVKGVELQDVFVLPRQAVRVGGEVITIKEDNTIFRKEVDPIWSEEDNVILSGTDGSLDAGEVVCLTPLAFPANGAKVLPTIDGVLPETEIPNPNFGSKGKGGKGKGKAEGEGIGQGPGKGKPAESAQKS
ncbi:MAG: efflux transporter periplasmic adaptor subunit [Verrucomicrobiales bacterium]|nr:efflux transporter periplasmic adaptor subunit [Verrucomicrobiales bacterium]